MKYVPSKLSKSGIILLDLQYYSQGINYISASLVWFYIHLQDV